MTAPKTHRQRAERALFATKLDKTDAFCESGAFDHYSAIVARETRPDELLEAARFVLDKCGLYGPADRAREKLRAALSLYEEEG